MSRTDSVLVAGAGGFIGGHLVRRLRAEGYSAIRAVDIKPLSQWYQVDDAADNRELDLRLKSACDAAVEGCQVIYNLACNMGGMGFIEHNKALCMVNSLINTHLLLAAQELGASRYFFASTACVYRADRQADRHGAPLREDDVYPAMPEDGYGWEKLFSERMCRHFREDFGLGVAIARIHNTYGPHGTYDGGREKAPAAICRKVAEAELSGRHEIEIWGDGEQTRSFMYIDDCIEGIVRLMDAGQREPVNLGSAERVSVNRLVDIAEEIAGIRLRRIYRPDAPRGVTGRSSDNTRIQAALGWQPRIPLRDGLEPTYRWIRGQLLEA